MHKNRIALKAVFWQAKTLAKPYAARVFVVCGKQELKRGWPPEKVKKRKKTFVLQLCSKEQFELKKAQWEVLHSKCIQFFGVESLLHDAVLEN